MRVDHGAITISGVAANEPQKLVECLLPFGRYNGPTHMNVDLVRALEIASQDDVGNRKRIVVHNREGGPSGSAVLESRQEFDNPDLADEIRLFGRLLRLKPASAHVSADGDQIDSADDSDNRKYDQ